MRACLSASPTIVFCESVQWLEEAVYGAPVSQSWSLRKGFRSSINSCAPPLAYSRFPVRATFWVAKDRMPSRAVIAEF